MTTEVPDLPPVRDPTAGRSLRRATGLARNGHAAMAARLLADGVASYVFLAAAGRALGPERFALVSVLWSALFLVGNGLYLPLEQELSRSIAARRARGVGFGALVQRVGSVGAAVLGVVIVAAVVAHGRISDALFRGQGGYVTVLVVGIAGVGFMFLVRGLLAGTDRFHGYATLFACDAATKAVPVLALAAAGVDHVLPYAVLMALSGVVGAAAPLARGTGIDRAGPPPPWRPLLSSMGFLLLASFLSSLTMNIPTLAVEVLATPAQAAEAGVFLSGLVIARVPLFFFQALQAAVLPRLSRFAASEDMAGFRHTLRFLGAALGGITVAATLGSAVLGPPVVQLLFGADFDLLGARDMGMLTLASMLMMGALTVNQAQIALHHQHQTGWPWGAGALVFVVVAAATGPDLLLRVELAMVAAAVVVLAAAAAVLAGELRHPDEHRDPTPEL